MEKKQRDILIAVVAGACVLIICVIVGRILLVGGIVGGIHGTLMNMIGIDGGILGSTEETKITELNQPYEHNGLKIAATDIETMVDSYTAMVDSYSEDKMIIAVKLVIENVSSSKKYVDGIMALNAYVDDVAAPKAYSYDSPFDDFLGFQELLPGKRAEGYYCVEAPKGAQKIELNYKDDFFCNVNVTFVLEVPPVEE